MDVLTIWPLFISEYDRLIKTNKKNNIELINNNFLSKIENKNPIKNIKSE